MPVLGVYPHPFLSCCGRIQLFMAKILKTGIAGLIPGLILNVLVKVK